MSQPWGRGVLLLASFAGCSDLPPPPIGQLRLGLSSGIGEERYELTQASFAIEGAVELSLDSEEERVEDALQRSLPEGDYRALLLDGWQLERVNPGGSTEVEAELSSDNPLPFSIRAGELTTVTFQFRTLDGDASPGAAVDGNVRIAIEVDGESSPHVAFTELMKNPDALPDADGEWFELYNAGGSDIDLGGCSVARDDQSLAIEGSLPFPAGTYLTFSNSEAPGFAPNVLYSGFTLPNTGAFVLRLDCAGQVLDEVAFDPALTPQRPGRSSSLSASALDAASNDDPSRWCEGVTSYNGDFGTPGSANADCAP